MSSRSLEDLHRLFKHKAYEFVDASKAAGLDVLIYCTLRDDREQDELYEIGRTKPGKIVTNARGGQSAHNRGLAFDGVPLVHGKPAWDDKALWEVYGNVASAVGLEWAGHWVSFKEFPHVQMPGWADLPPLK